MLLSTAFFPPIQYFTKLYGQSKISLEACENYQKQSYRNRCCIYGANGVICLNVPILKGRSPGMLVKDARISYATTWQKQHLKSIESAYKNSPFFEFYIDELYRFWNEKFDFLFDLNTQVMNCLIKLIELPELEIVETKHFKVNTSNEDFRFSIHPKVSYTDDETFTAREYQQVFSERFGFKANLSILDLLFLKGPETDLYLKTCKK